MKPQQLNWPWLSGLVTKISRFSLRQARLELPRWGQALCKGPGPWLPPALGRVLGRITSDQTWLEKVPGRPCLSQGLSFPILKGEVRGQVTSKPSPAGVGLGEQSEQALGSTPCCPAWHLLMFGVSALVCCRPPPGACFSSRVASGAPAQPGPGSGKSKSVEVGPVAAAPTVLLNPV